MTACISREIWQSGSEQRTQPSGSTSIVRGWGPDHSHLPCSCTWSQVAAEGQDSQMSLCPLPSNQETQTGAGWSRPQDTLTKREREPGNPFCRIFPVTPYFACFGPINIHMTYEDLSNTRLVSVRIYLTGVAMSCKIFMTSRFQRAVHLWLLTTRPQFGSPEILNRPET